MKKEKKIILGDFSNLAKNYSLYRPDYSKTVKKLIIDRVGKNKIKFVDVGAGTGIWTRMVSGDKRICSATAVEPNKEMLNYGKQNKDNKNIKWKSGSGEKTNLMKNNFDLVSMASSFHWTNFDKAMSEFSRILKKGGIFVALWNPRIIEKNKLLTDIEKKIFELKPNLKRQSSGKSKAVEDLCSKLDSHRSFEDLIYIEGKHKIKLSVKQYIGVWRSVNDVQVKLGDKFEDFILYIQKKIRNKKFIETEYLTRAWSVKKK